MSNARNLAQGAVVPWAFRNKLYNGGFDVWQRGTSFDGTYSRGTYYGADRWQNFAGGGAAGATFSRISYNGPDSVYALRAQRNSGSTMTATINIGQSFETIDVYPLRGKQVTLSFRALTGSNFSGTNLQALIITGTGTDSSLASGFTSPSTLATLNVAPTNGVQGIYTVTATVPTNASQLGVLFVYTPVGTAGANDYFELTNVQLELGAVSNSGVSFERRPFALELLMCQRFYETSYDYSWTPGSTGSGGDGAMTNTADATCNYLTVGTVVYKSMKRAVPTVVIYNPSTGATGSARVTNSNSDATTNVQGSGMNGFSVFINGISVSASFTVQAHWTANAEI